ncbi:HAD-superfamily hydrolase, subfamily IB (PSPase-like) [Anaeromyxobacter dehalogenans 2CP-1]|uniref:HAD-superfamily hydrolase, subfamily IB (PSPase-like) n=1 Tax=Anaeromyxobacter dehalogenans (strain ATCC BAA-258 / DSM 21875 / 2CP-1) TaxID=455488 RepID=B8JD17_ANAD2|nr:HAD-IB family phosphatase [Anaeromyxobacter dehalogenans]ACL64045.1 HAD-superfamily hydrolase, subfamily IB (PSPase-like) [Anaeromyxobacter dehalogenans 2CP-1]
MRAPWAIVCDFDGTALTEDLGDQVAFHFAGVDAYRAAEDRYRAGELDFGRLLQAVFGPIRASRAEIAAFARARAAWRPGFEDFLDACRRGGRPFLVVSSGLDAYIEPVLEGLPPALRAHVELRANRAACGEDGLRVGFHGADCGFCGFCKGDVVRELQAAGHKVAVCGDGTGDRHAADAADHVFARAGSSLVRYCAEQGIRHDVFETFGEVMARFPA